MSKKKQISIGVISSIILFAISGLFWVSGYMKEDIATDIGELKVQISDNEILADRMGFKINYLLDFDHQRIQTGNDHLRAARILSYTLNTTNSSLSAIDRQVLMDEIYWELYYYEELIRNSYQGDITKSFYKDSETEYFVATEDIDGFNLSFSLDEFFSFNDSKTLHTVDIDPEIFLTEYNFLMVNYIVNYQNLGHQWFSLPGSYDHWVEFYSGKLIELQSSISLDQASLADLENKSSFYGYGVSAITITSILATALANQVNDKEREKEFSHIKAKIYEDKSMIIDKSFNYAIPLLVLALVLAILGFILPVILF